MSKKFIIITSFLFSVIIISQLLIFTFFYEKLDTIEVSLNAMENNINKEINTEQEINTQENNISPIPVSFENSPIKGNPDASVTIVTFTDYECPYCKEADLTFQKLFEKYGDRAQFATRNYPIASIHSGAVDAALAGLCAFEQNKFWEYHNAMFSKSNGSGSLSKEVLKQIATDLELEKQSFDSCLDSKKYIEQVQKDFEDGNSYGVTGTPTFFINNHMVTGNLPIEVFEQIIEEELRNVK